MWEPLETYLRSLITDLPEQPRAILVASAHWEEPEPTLMTAAGPPMLYDYGDFPPEAYELRWDAPGPDVALVSRAQELLAVHGFTPSLDSHRGFDHGTFVPLKVALPEPNLPCSKSHSSAASIRKLILPSVPRSPRSATKASSSLEAG